MFNILRVTVLLVVTIISSECSGDGGEFTNRDGGGNPPQRRECICYDHGAAGKLCFTRNSAIETWVQAPRCP